jgi:hypothetical protein
MDGLGPSTPPATSSGRARILDGKFNGPVELAQRLANSQAVSNCMVSQWFRYSMGRMETTNDACSIQGIVKRSLPSGGNIRELLARVALSPAFPQRPSHTGS